MQTLRIHLFGQVRIFNAESTEPAKVTHHVQALLAYLLLHRHRSHSREVLADLFWGNHPQSRARGSLNTTLWRLRQILEPTETLRGKHLLAGPTGEVGFNPASSFWMDAATFEEQSLRLLQRPAELMQEADAEALEAVVQLYTGELLEGFYEDWALRERERLNQLYLNSLVHLMHYCSYRHAYKESLHWGQRVLDKEPLREEIQREMMRTYLMDGQRARALQQYEQCRQALATELGIAPMEETQTLHAAILNGAIAPQVAVRAAVQSHHEDVLSMLRLALQSFDETRASLQRLVELLEQSVGQHPTR